MQLILAGKAHPQDLPGQALIKKWNDFIKRPEVKGHIVFLSDYDMQLAQELVQGIDLWINTPRRPWEACGTSGMKVLVNGGLNFSELDGWWAEAYSPQVGWAIGDGQEHGEDPAWDALEAEAMYSLLEQEVVPSSMQGMNAACRRSGWGVSARVCASSRRSFPSGARFESTPSITTCPPPLVMPNAPPRKVFWVLRCFDGNKPSLNDGTPCASAQRVSKLPTIFMSSGYRSCRVIFLRMTSELSFTPIPLEKTNPPSNP